MWLFTKEEGLSAKQIKELKNQWFSMEEAIEELAYNGNKITVATFRRRANQVNREKDFFEMGKPQVKEKRLKVRGVLGKIIIVHS